MSTKCTLAHGESWHLFEECFEQSNIHLQLEHVPASLHIYDEEPAVTVHIPIQVWREIVTGWLASDWAQHPERDNQEIEWAGVEQVSRLKELFGGSMAIRPSTKEEDPK